jgi:hypothetical protein
MTTYAHKEVRCSNCGHTSTIVKLRSWHGLAGSRRQLDLRDDQAPIGLHALNLECCSNCRHTAPDLAAPLSLQQREVLQQFDPDAYGVGPQTSDGDVAGLILHAQQCVAASRQAAAAHAYMHAAWLLDDRIASRTKEQGAGSETLDFLAEVARMLRRLAATAVRRSADSEAPFARTPLVWAVHADLLRRAGDLKRSAAACREALKGQVFESEDDLTVRDMLQHTLNLATDKDTRVAWVDDAEARAVDYPERVARRETVRALKQVKHKIRQEDAAARLAPGRLVEHLQAQAPATSSSDLLSDWPLPEWLPRTMRANAKAYGWPLEVLGPLLVAGLAQALPDLGSQLRAFLESQSSLLQGRQREVDYLAVCLRETSAAQWSYRAPPHGFAPEPSATVTPAPPPQAQPTPADELRQVFQNKFHLELPPEFSLEALQPIRNAHLLSSQTEGLQQILVGPVSTKRFEELAPGHRTVGFWGYGTNSYYFYFISNQPNEKVYLRLHTGGAYTDTVTAAQEITDLLPVLLFLMREVRRLQGNLLLIQSAGEGDIYVRFAGPVQRLQGQLLGRADAMTHVQRLLDSALHLASVFDATELRAQAMKIAQAVYLEESRFKGNERVGMRALGAAMDIIRASGTAANAAAYQHDVMSSLAALAERHEDRDGEHERGRAAIRRFLGLLRQAWLGP